MKITKHQEFNEFNTKESFPELLFFFSEEQNSEQTSILFPNDYNSEESKKNKPKIVDRKNVININEIIGEETETPLYLEIIYNNSIQIPA